MSQQAVTAMQAAEHAAQSGGGEALLLFLVLSLAVGAAARHLLKRTPISYTVWLLLAGLALGLLDRNGAFEGDLEVFSRALSSASSLDPHLIQGRQTPKAFADLPNRQIRHS